MDDDLISDELAVVLILSSLFVAQIVLEIELRCLLSLDHSTAALPLEIYLGTTSSAAAGRAVAIIYFTDITSPTRPRVLAPYPPQPTLEEGERQYSQDSLTTEIQERLIRTEMRCMVEKTRSVKVNI